MPININALKGQVPDTVIEQLPDTITKFELNTPLRLAHFLSQAADESEDFKKTSENLSYGLAALYSSDPHHPALWQHHFTSIADATPYVHNSEKIGNRIYSNRMGNGDEASGDGYKFRGRGYIQLTGKENYQIFSTAINVNLISNPDLVATKYPLASAAWFFHKNGLHTIADEGATSDVVTKITKRVNGGVIGLEKRIQEFNKFYNILK